MITQANAIYFLIGTGILFLIGIGFLVHGFRLKPKAISSTSTAIPQSGAIPKIANPSTHKLLHALICEIVGVGLMAWGAFMATQNTQEVMSGGIGFILIFFGFIIFCVGIGIGVS